MHRSTPAFALLTAIVVAVTAMAAQDVSAGTPTMIHAQSLDSRPASRMEGDEAMDAAVAAAVIGAVAQQFGETEVAVKLDQVAVDAASLRDRTVSGDGRVQLGGDPVWIPFQFAALYDTVGTTVSYPQLKIGGGADAQSLAGNSTIALALSSQVDAALRNEFPQQPVEMVMERFTTSAIGTRYLRVKGTGTADFGVEGTTAAQVEALYDRSKRQWLRVSYELGTTSNWADRPSKPLAAR